MPHNVSRLSVAPEVRGRSLGSKIGGRAESIIQGLFNVGREPTASRRRAGLASGLTAFGTSLLKSSAPVDVGTRPGFLADLGVAIEAGQAGAAAGLQREDALEVKQSGQRRQQVLQQFAGLDFTDPRVLQHMFGTMLIEGEYDGAKSIAEVLKSLDRGAGTFQIKAGIGPDGNPAFFRIGATGQAQLLEASPIPPSPRSTLKIVRDPVSGLNFYSEFDPETRQWTRTDQQAPSTPGEKEKQAQFYFEMLPMADAAFLPFADKPPSRFQTIAQQFGLREVTTPEIQALEISGGMYSDAFLRMTTGAAYSTLEQRNVFRMFVPLPGDSKSTLDLKEEGRRRLKAALDTARGRAAWDADGGLRPEDILGDTLYNQLQAKSTAALQRELGERDELDEAFDIIDETERNR